MDQTIHNRTALRFLVQDLFIFFLLNGAIYLSIDLLPIALFFSILLGINLVSLFALVHDCGHRSFHTSKIVNHGVGFVLAPLVGWTFTLWRRSHLIHHRYTNHLTMDFGYVVDTHNLVKKKDRFHFSLRLMSICFASWALFLNVIVECLRRSSKAVIAKNDTKVFLEILGSLSFYILYGWMAYYFYGFSGLMYFFVLPQLVFNLMFGLIALMHHTHPKIDSSLVMQGNLSAENQSVDLILPDWMEFVFHYLTNHTNHHKYPKLPHYRLGEARRVALAHTKENFQYPFRFSYVGNILYYYLTH